LLGSEFARSVLVIPRQRGLLRDKYLARNVNPVPAAIRKVINRSPRRDASVRSHKIYRKPHGAVDRG
jgi:hypothetical protein